MSLLCYLHARPWLAAALFIPAAAPVQEKSSSATNLSPTRWLNLRYLTICSLFSARITRRKLHFTQKKNPIPVVRVGGKHIWKQNRKIAWVLPQSNAFCYPRCCNHTITHSSSLWALMKHQQMVKVSTASAFPPSLGGRCSLKKGSQTGFRCDRFVNSQAAIRKSVLLPKMCSLEHHWMSSVFTVMISLRSVPQEKGSQGHQRNIKS